MKKLTIILIAVVMFAVFSLNSHSQDQGRQLSSAEQKFIIANIGGIWEIEKRIFDDGTVLTPPRVRGYLIITADYWTQLDSQIVAVGDAMPYSRGYFGTTDLQRTRSIEKIFLQMQLVRESEDRFSGSFSTEERLQKTFLVLESDGVTQRFDAGGEVKISNDRFFQKGKSYTTYWKRIKKPSEVFSPAK